MENILKLINMVLSESNALAQYIKPKNMKSNLHLILIVFLGMFSCQPEPLEIRIPPKPEPEPDSLLIWKVPLHKDTVNTCSIKNVTLYQDRVVTSVSEPFLGNNNETLLCFDTTGTLQWWWQDYEPYHKLLSISDEGSIGKYFYFTTWLQNFCIDITTGEEVWRFIPEAGEPCISSNNADKVIKTITYYSPTPRSDSTAIFVSNIEDGNFEEVFKIVKTKGDGIGIPNVSTYFNDSGEEILVFQNNTLYMPTDYKEVIDLYSYNLTKRELMWKVENISELSWNMDIPQIDDNNIYFATKYRMFSFDKKTGEKNWERLMPHDFQGSNYLLYKDLLITNLDNGDLIAISKHNGETVWHNKRLSACCVKLRIYDDKIYFGNGDLFIVEATTGKVLHRYRSPSRREPGRSNAFFLDAIAVDVENERMYTTDSYYLMCIKHPKL